MENVEQPTSIVDIHGKPRRSNPDTIQYLRSLPLAEEHDDDPSQDTLHIMLQALYEIRQELASLASTEIGSSVLEHLIQTLLTRSSVAKDILWRGLIPYVQFLATHRYGSHVLQVLLSETTRPATTAGAKDDVALADDAPEIPDGARPEQKSDDWRIVLANSVSQETSVGWMTDMCASHVLRSLLAGLTGRVYAVESMEGKTKKKKKKKRKREEEYIIVNEELPDKFAKAAEKLTKGLWEGFDENWPYDTSACPVLCFIVKEESFDSKLIAEDWMYDPTASRFWQASIKAKSSVDTIADDFRKNVKAYIEHEMANYCVQTMLEFHRHWVEECLEQLPYLVDPASNRRGVLWKLTTACQLSHQKDRIIKAIEGYGMSKFVRDGAPSLATLVALLPSVESLLHPSLSYVCQNSLASKILVEPWIEHSREKFPLEKVLSDLVRHPVGQHVVAKYVLETGSIPDQLWEFRRTNHPVVKRLIFERLQLPLFEEKGAKAWKEALGITSKKKARRNSFIKR